MASNFNNISITGDYTGTVTKTYKIVIVITNQTVQYKFATKDEGSDYGSFGTLRDVTLNSATTLSHGLSVTFTASAVLDYNNDDTWYFTAHPVLDLGDVKYSKMETLQRQDETDLILFSKDGDVAIIEDYDNSPNVLLNQGNVGQFTTFDVEKKNKELYVALGQSSSPRWAGYLKNMGLGTDNNERFIVDNTIDAVNSNYDPRNEVFDKFIVLRNGEANTENSKCIVGIKDNEPFVYVYNITNNLQKVIKYRTEYVPVAIRPWYGNNSGTSNYYCEGFILLCNREQSNEIAELQFWSIETEGTDANIGTDVNKDKTINIRRPSVDGGQQIDRYHDFLVVPSNNDLSTATYTLMLVADRDVFTNPDASWLYKVEHNNFYTKANDDDIVSSNILDVTPKIKFDNLSNNNNNGHDAVWHWGMVSPIKPMTNNSEYDGNDKHKFVIAGSFEGVVETSQMIKGFPKNSLQFGGFDGGGGNPVVLFTCRFRSIETISIQKKHIPTDIFSSSELTDWNSHGSDEDAIKFTGPFISDDATLKTNKRYKPVEWGTYAIPINSTNGRYKHKLFAHLNQADIDNDQTVQKFTSLYPQATEYSNMIASGEDDLFLSGGGGAISKVVPSRICVPYKGSMYLYGDRGVSGARMGMVFWSYENQEYVHFRWSSEGAGKGISYSDTDVVDVFPSTTSENYTRWNVNHSSATDVDTKAINTHYFKYALPANLQSSSQVKDTWVIGEGSRSIAINSSFWYANDTEAFFSNRILTSEDTTRRLVKVDFGNGAFTNQIQQTENLLKIESSSTQPNDTWIGETSKKAFYKVSFLYDGYQESALLQTVLSVTNYHSNSHHNIEDAVAIDLKINKEAILNQRITDVVLYRGLSSKEDGLEPEGLYRFIEQVKLKDFNLATGEDYYVATVTDRGKTGATYESLNGISELSYALEVNYTLNAEQNGYMFIGNCEHTQFEDASNIIFRSQSGKYSIFDWSSDFVTLPFIPTALEGFMGKIYAFSHTQLAIINAENLFIEDVVEGVGCIGPDAIKVTDSGMLFCDYKNIYLSTPKIVSIGEIIKEVDDDGWNKLTTQEKDTIVIGYDSIRNAYLLFYTRGTNYRCWAFSIRSKRWDFWETPNKVLSAIEDKDGHCILLLDNNQIIKYLAGPNKRSFEWESKKLTFGYDMQEKRIRNVKIATNDKNNTNIQYKVDGYEGSWQDGTDISSNFTGSNTIAIKLNSAHGVKHNWIKYKVTGTNDSSASDKKVFAISTIYKAKRYK
jgi:hypothetical protein